MVEFGGVTADEVAAFVRAEWTAFGSAPPENRISRAERFGERERMIAARDGKQIVGTAEGISFELTLPGGATVPAGGLTSVGVLPTHRRTGLLTELMRLHFEDCARRGELVSLLTASEANIYGRFGYGTGVPTAWYAIERRDAKFAEPPTCDGRMRLVEREEAETLIPAAYDDYRRATAGEIGRSPNYWSLLFDLFSTEDSGLSPMFYVVHENATGRVDGYAAYRIKEEWNEDAGLPQSKVFVNGIASSAAEVDAALFRYLCNLDLTGTLTFQDRPIDDPVRLRLADPRRYRTLFCGDHLWVKVLDVEGVMSQRSYLTDEPLTFSAGSTTYALAEGQCEKSSGAPDVAMDMSALGAVCIGGVRPSVLARAGRVVEHVPGGLARADRVFMSVPPPLSFTHF